MSMKTVVSIFLFLSIVVLEVAPTFMEVHSYAIEETSEKSQKEGAEETKELEDEFKKFYQNYLPDVDSGNLFGRFVLNENILDTKNPFISINTPPPERA